MNYRGCGLELSVGSSGRVGIHGFLSQKLAGWAVPYPGNSGNLVFIRSILEWTFILLVLTLALNAMSQQGVG